RTAAASVACSRPVFIAQPAEYVHLQHGARSSYRSHRLRPVCPVPQSNLVLAFALPFFGVPRKLGLMNKRILLLTTLLLGSGCLAPLAAEVSSNAPAQSASSSEKEPAKQTGKDSP